MFDILARFLVRRSAWVLLGLAAVSLAAATFAARINFDFSPQSMFTGNDELVKNAERVKEVFGYEDAVVMVLLESVGEPDVLGKDALTWQAEIANKLEAVPRVREVQTLARLKRPRVTLGPPPEMTLVPVIQNHPVDEDDEERLRILLDKSKLIEGTLLGADRRVAAVLAIVDPAARDVDQMRSVVNDVKAVLDQTPPPADYQVHITGLPAVRVAIVDSLQADQAWLIPIAGGLYLLALAVVFRRFSGAVLPLAAAGMGLVWTLAVAEAMGQSFNIVTNVLPMLLLIIGVSNCVHVVWRYAEESNRPGADHREAARRTIASMGLACFATLLTTSIGFASLLTARSNALQTFGVQSAIGLAFLFVSIIFTLGAALPYLAAPRYREPITSREPWIVRIAMGAGFAAVRHPAVTLGCCGVLMLGSLWLGTRMEINSYNLETFDAGHPAIRIIRLVDERLGGLLPVEIRLKTDREGAFHTPEVYRRVAEVERFALEQPAVLFARSYVDMHQEIDAEAMKRDELRRELPPLSDEGQRRIDRSTRFIRKVQDELRYDAFVSDDGQQVRILIKVRDVGTKRLVALFGTLEAKLAAVFPPGSGIDHLVTGDAYLNTQAMDTMIRDLVRSLFGASVVIFAIMAFVFRSVKLGFIASIPNVTPLVLTLGYMALRGFELNVGNVLVFTISLGVAVDNTIHFVFRVREELTHDCTMREAIERAVMESGRAMVTTSFLIILGLVVLMFSEFVPTRRFAELTSVTMIGALIGDLMLLPACLVAFWRPKAKKQADQQPADRAPETGLRLNEETASR